MSKMKEGGNGKAGENRCFADAEPTLAGPTKRVLEEEEESFRKYVRGVPGNAVTQALREDTTDEARKKYNERGIMEAKKLANAALNYRPVVLSSRSHTYRATLDGPGKAKDTEDKEKAERDLRKRAVEDIKREAAAIRAQHQSGPCGK